jgi:hypothetical protein
VGEQWKENVAILLANRNRLSSTITVNTTGNTLSFSGALNAPTTTTPTTPLATPLSTTQHPPHHLAKLQFFTHSQHILIHLGDLLWNQYNNLEAAHFWYFTFSD